MLDRVQSWMYRVIADPRGVAIAAREADEHILPSRTLSAAERVGIYAGMYPMRMVEALQGDYPALAHYLGEHDFNAVVSRYVQKYPSSSYTLNRLGDSFPDFLEGFERDLARLELAMTHVFDEEDTEVADLTLLPPDRAENMRLIPIKAFRLLALHYNSNDCFRAFRDGEQMRPKRGNTYLLVHRKDYGVMRMPLTKKGYEFLRELAGGKTLGEAILACKPSQHALFEWFRDWSAAGIFRSFGE